MFFGTLVSLSSYYIILTEVLFVASKFIHMCEPCRFIASTSVIGTIWPAEVSR